MISHRPTSFLRNQRARYRLGATLTDVSDPGQVTVKEVFARSAPFTTSSTATASKAGDESAATGSAMPTITASASAQADRNRWPGAAAPGVEVIIKAVTVNRTRLQVIVIIAPGGDVEALTVVDGGGDEQEGASSQLKTI